MKVVTDSRHYDEIAKQIKEYGKLGDDVTFTPEELHGQIGVEYVYYTGVNDGREEGRQEGYASGLSQGEEQGRQAQNEEFWESMISSETANYQYSFGGARWKDATFKPTRPIIGSNFLRCFAECGVKNILQPINVENCTGSAPLQNMFYQADIVNIKKIITSTNTVWDSTTFKGCTKLKKVLFEGAIGKSIDLSPCTSLLKECFIGELASAEQLDAGKNLYTYAGNTYYGGVITALSTDVTGQTLTLPSAAVTDAFGSVTSDEWLALIASKSNQYNGTWTISLK